MNSLYSLKAGSRLDDRYIVMDVIGEGGFGITYQGFDERLEMKVAIKEYFPQHLAARMNTYGNEVTVTKEDSLESFEKGKKRFLEEAMILGRLESEEGIVNVKDYFEENNTAYFVMEFLDGETLEALVDREGPVNMDDLVLLLEPVMKSLERAHQEGLIHRDISPDNIILTSSGAARLVDFGAARNYMAGNKSQTVILKPGYAPEEQYRTDEEQGPWTDVYALAATIYSCITGLRLPEACRRVTDDCLSNPSELGVDISPAQEQALMKGLEIYAKDRWQTMAEFRQALMASESLDFMAEDGQAGSGGRRFAEEETGIRPAALAGVAGLLILLLAGGGFLLHMLSGKPADTDDQIKAANEYKLTESTSQTSPADDQDQADDSADDQSAQGSEDSQDQGAEGFTGFGEKWDKNKISQDSVDKYRSGADELEEEDAEAAAGQEDQETIEAATEQKPEGWEDDTGVAIPGQEAQATTEAPAQATTEAPAQATTEAPAQATTEASAQATTEAPAQATTEAPTQATTEIPGLTAQVPVEASTEEKPEGWVDESGAGVSGQEIQDETGLPVQVPAEAGTEERPEGWVDESGTVIPDEPAQATTEAPVQETTEAPAQETTEASVQETTEAPVQEEPEAAVGEIVEEGQNQQPEGGETEVVVSDGEEFVKDGGVLAGETGEDPIAQVDAIDASQGTYTSQDGYPSYISESVDTSRYQVTSFLDGEGILRKSLVTDSQTGISGEIYYKNISQESVAAGGVSLRNTAFCTYMQTSAGECQAYFKDGQVTEFMGPDGQVQDFGDGIDFTSFYDLMQQGAYGDLAKTLLDMTVPGWQG